MKKLIFLLTLVSALFTNPALAEQKKVKGNWDIHYIAFQSTFLEPNVAKEYNLQRSKYKGVINIAVLDNQNNDKAQNVALSGKARNLLGQYQTLKFKKVTEGQSIYYLAQFSFVDKQDYHFDITVQLGNRQEKITFNNKMYSD